MSDRCELSDEELVKKVRMWVDELCRTGGKGWSLQVPVNMERDPDVLISELCMRFDSVLAPYNTEPVTAGEPELRDAQLGEYKTKCDWPGCFQESLCTSGNVGGAFVCRTHFEVTNGRAAEDLTSYDIKCLEYMIERAAARGAEETTQTIQRNCLQEADQIINGERQDMYGSPEDSFEIIAGYWNVFLRQKIKDACRSMGLDTVDIPDLLTPLDTTNMMILFKQARKLGQKPCRDNYVDSCGYEAIGADRLIKED